MKYLNLSATISGQPGGLQRAVAEASRAVSRSVEQLAGAVAAAVEEARGLGCPIPVFALARDLGKDQLKVH